MQAIPILTIMQVLPSITIMQVVSVIGVLLFITVFVVVLVRGVIGHYTYTHNISFTYTNISIS